LTGFGHRQPLNDTARGPVRMIAKISSCLLILPSVILRILIVELLCRLFLPLGVVYNVRQRLQRVVFLDGSPPIFRNEDNIFTPSAAIRLVGALISAVVRRLPAG